MPEMIAHRYDAALNCKDTLSLNDTPYMHNYAQYSQKNPISASLRLII